MNIFIYFIISYHIFSTIYTIACINTIPEDKIKKPNAITTLLCAVMSGWIFFPYSLGVLAAYLVTKLKEEEV